MILHLSFFSYFNKFFSKSWFFFENEYIALGNSIESSSSNSIWTTLDQRLLNGAIYVSSQAQPLSKGEYNFSNLWWIHHNSIGYLFPSSFSLTVSNKQQTGTWQSIGASNGTVQK